MQTTASAWRYVPVKEKTGAQIDLLIDRKDQCINLCEIKFSTGEFVIDKKYAAELDQKVKVFTEKTQPRKTIFPTMITTYGVKQNDYYTGRVQAEIKMEQLFT
ncbi:MAG: ATPase [Chitinophagaceae bacterium]|nr:ATPase [Chitinophagaceae bacterium]